MDGQHETAGSPIADLKDDHRVIERGLAVLELLARRARQEDAFETEAIGRCVEFFKLFADACHHGKEEDLLFPALEARGVPRQGGPIGVMLEEHRVGRGYVAEMAAGLAQLEDNPATARERLLTAADRYVGLLRAHIFKEDNILFEIGDQVLTEGDRRELDRGFCDVRCRAFDGRTREQLLGIVSQLEADWLGR